MKNNNKKIIEPNKFDFLHLENASDIKGGHTIKFCYDVELKQCIVAEAKYCGPGASASPVEVTGPTNPWKP